MRINSLSLTNFRGLKQLEFSFETNITVIAGINGSGKSAILNAISTISSHLLPQITPSKEQSFSFSDNDIFSGQSSLTVSAKFDIKSHRCHAEMLRSKQDLKKIEELQERRDKIRFAIRQTKKKSQEEIELQRKLEYIKELLSGEKDHFSFQVEGSAEKTTGNLNSPFVVLYNTSRFLTRLPPVLPKLKPFEPATAYAKALDGLEVNLNDFTSWFRAVESGSLGQYRNGKAFYSQLQKALDTLLPGFTNLTLHTGPPPFLLMEKNGTQLSLEKFSDGEKGLLALAFDLSRRLAIANPDSDNPIAEGRALVLIDEIELHLHPRWQREVIRRLTTTFKKCQFVVTTHSPQVMGEVQTESLFLLKNGKVSKPAQSFGMDSNWILDVLMESDRLNPQIKIRLEKVFELIEKRQLDKAEDEIKKLRSTSGNTDRLQQAASLVERLKVLGQ